MQKQNQKTKTQNNCLELPSLSPPEKEIGTHLDSRPHEGAPLDARLHEVSDNQPQGFQARITTKQKNNNQGKFKTLPSLLAREHHQCCWICSDVQRASLN
jgi:hypothetical protein